MGYISPKGRNWGPVVNWDDLGKLYASVAIAWTVILLAGMLWLVRHRKMPFLKMRNVPLAITATSFLHVYLVKILLAYTTNGHFPCSVEFWVMSIYLPFGIALFQANTMQLLSISTRQRKLLERSRVSVRQLSHGSGGVRGLWSRFRAFDSLKKTYVFIGIGMLLQFVITAAIYGTNHKLQGHWGNIPKPQGQARCRKGFEWIPSSIWQLFWSCLYGPYLLYKVWHVRDTHYWRLQTIVSVVSGYPGSPLWLAALWSVKFKPINRYWIPPMWLAPGIIVMQAVTIFLPIYEGYRSKTDARNVLDILKKWESNTSSTLSSGSEKFTRNSESSGENGTASSMKGSYRSIEMYGMAAFQNALVTDPHSLLQFAATKDFTAENIIFLLQLQAWRIACENGVEKMADLPAPTRGLLFQMAVEIYAESISEATAEFPINIEGPIRTRLDAVFGPAMASRGRGVVNAVDPVKAVSPFDMSNVEALRKFPGKLWKTEVNTSSTAISASEKNEGTDGIPTSDALANMPAEFDERVFDAAEKSIKYLVLTNTWRKFVEAMQEQSPHSSQEGLR